ncbi:hypothetical protein IW262DRAFT_1454751 [Armillaria fumosa]|nr:hypothetical protein IW262DRAFT_1454751 [Armillaria fumosa]
MLPVANPRTKPFSTQGPSYQSSSVSSSLPTFICDILFTGRGFFMTWSHDGLHFWPASPGSGYQKNNSPRFAKDVTFTNAVHASSSDSPSWIGRYPVLHFRQHLKHSRGEKKPLAQMMDGINGPQLLVKLGQYPSVVLVYWPSMQRSVWHISGNSSPFASLLHRLCASKPTPITLQVSLFQGQGPPQPTQVDYHLVSSIHGSDGGHIQLPLFLTQFLRVPCPTLLPQTEHI